ncbi:D-lactate dehydrogenase [Alteromonas oceanisediminis]|uniref:D-lactate dehydrogenase n=1 Tax=Alteromonas oceanisediminis TaxID=2836180 RepID=UPI001BDA78C8|nr:D-lactate dehydrogenase [Alteromonas oceanisediminis]MBT0587444.1 D-lactate dehydrogenase [Alteromonas oceanisediminis]
MPAHALLSQLSSLLGKKNIATRANAKQHFTRGWRSGGGDALAVLFPQTLVQLWQALEACVEANCIIIMQAANTGLTEGSTPSGNQYDRAVVVINTLAINDIIVLDQSEQVLSFAGATLHQLESVLQPMGRSPHSVIGSSCLGASIVGGVANNSGGALVKRGPAYTELALFARVNEHGKLELVNHLGIELGNEPIEILTRLQQGKFNKAPAPTHAKASASDYETIVRDVNAATPSRFNADPTRLFEASGCAGKLAVFAVRLDTFATAKREQTFYVGCNSPHTLSKLRRVMLSTFTHLPDVAEYMHRDTFNIAHQYGKDTFLSVQKLGTARLPALFSLKGKIDATLSKLPWAPTGLTDRLMQSASALMPEHLPQRLLDFENRYEHHLILKTTDAGIEEARQCLSDFFQSEPLNNVDGNYFACTDDEARSAYLHRFAAAGAAIRYQLIHRKRVGDILALDIALRRNDADWVEVLPDNINWHIEKRLYYGHFFCHVFHQDYILKQGSDAAAVKKAMLAHLDSRGAKYPAEHNVGHLYEAEQTLQQFYHSLDPTNTFNPGIGGMSKHRRNCACC